MTGAEDVSLRPLDGVATAAKHLFVIAAGGRPVGTLWLELFDHDHAHIADVEIDPEHRGRGFGSRALELAEAEATRRGATSMSLNVYADNEGARRLYERLGYRPTRHTRRP